jgi:hypothetical protein
MSVKVRGDSMPKFERSRLNMAACAGFDKAIPSFIRLFRLEKYFI